MPSLAVCRSCGCSTQLQDVNSSSTSNPKNCPKCGAAFRRSHARPPVYRPGSRQLSEREVEVVRLLSMGKLTKQVADELGISIGTAFGYRNRIKSKLGLSSFAELIRYAVRANIVPSEPSPPDDPIVA